MVYKTVFIIRMICYQLAVAINDNVRLAKNTDAELSEAMYSIKIFPMNKGLYTAGLNCNHRYVRNMRIKQTREVSQKERPMV